MFLNIVFSCLLFFRLVFGWNNGLARTPPLGWMSWAKFYCEIDCVKHPNDCISEKLYKSMADRLIEDGFHQAGYNSIHIDDCWSEHQRDSDGKLVANRTRFSSGMAKLANYMHQRGLKLAIYADVGSGTCEKYPGSWGYEDIDARTFADWKIDYLKYDGCNLNYTHYEEGYTKMQKALAKQKQKIVYSTEWAIIYFPREKWAELNYTKISTVSNVNRVFWDVEKSWSSILSIIDYVSENQNKFIPVVGPGFWIDPDMIVVGNPELTLEQAKAQLTIWSIWSAPLIMSNDLRNLAPGTKEILLNRNVIAINQDPLGIMGALVYKNNNISIFVKKITPKVNETYSYAIAFLNRGNIILKKSIILQDVGLNHSFGYEIHDLWTEIHVGKYKPREKYRAEIPSTGVHFIKAIPLKGALRLKMDNK